jgi:hypothetical protein
MSTLAKCCEFASCQLETALHLPLSFQTIVETEQSKMVCKIIKSKAGEEDKKALICA